jgi:hypothetical protein
MALDPGQEEVAEPLRTVRVLAEAAVRVEPDEARVWLSITAVDASAGDALADVAESSRGTPSVGQLITTAATEATAAVEATFALESPTT